MTEKPSVAEEHVAERKTLTERRLARLAGMPATPEQLEKAEDAIKRVRIVMDSINKSEKADAERRGEQFEPVSKLEINGVWTHDIPSGHVDEQKTASHGFRVGANSMYEIEATKNGIELTERAEEWTKIRGGNSGPARSGWLRTREHVLFIDNDGLTQFGEFTTEPKNQPGHDHIGYDERTEEKALRETGDLRVPLAGYEAEFAERVISALEAAYTEQVAA